MEDAFLFEMIENAVALAADDLVLKGHFRPFAYALTLDNQSLCFSSDKSDDQEAYDDLEIRLKKEVNRTKFKALVLLQESPTLEALKHPKKQSIRLHVESADTVADKIGARYLYIPYELFVHEGKQEIKLFQPKPVAFPHEIFKT